MALFLFGAMDIASSGRGEISKFPGRFGDAQGTKSQRKRVVLVSFHWMDGGSAGGSSCS